MEFLVKINMENAAFETPEYEITQRLNKIHDQVRDGVVFGKVLDTNGNTCGFWGFVEKDELVEAAMEVVEVEDTKHNNLDQPEKVNLFDANDILQRFSKAAEKCRMVVAKEVARQIGDWRRF